MQKMLQITKPQKSVCLYVDEWLDFFHCMLVIVGSEVLGCSGIFNSNALLSILLKDIFKYQSSIKSIKLICQLVQFFDCHQAFIERSHNVPNIV